MLTLPGCAKPTCPIILGVADLGGSVDQETSFAIMDRYAEAGGNHFDTAHIYAAWLPGRVGSSERTLGRWLRSRGLVGKMLIATKGAHMALDGVYAPRVRPECIHADLQESLERLGVDRVDLYYLHRDDPTVPVECLLAALEAERARGRIGAYACSNWALPRLHEAQALAAARGWAGFAVNQMAWSLAAQPAEGPMSTYAVDPLYRRWHRETGLPLACYSSQAVGFFARTWTWPSQGHAKKFDAYCTETNVRRAWRAQAYAAARGVTPTRIALAWLLHQGHPVLPIIGGKTVAQISDSMAALKLSLSPGEVRDLERA